MQQSTVDAILNSTPDKAVKLGLTRCSVLLGDVMSTPKSAVPLFFGTDAREEILLPILYVLARKVRSAISRLNISNEGHFKESEIIATTMVEQQISREKEIYISLLAHSSMSPGFSSNFQKACEMTMVRLRSLFEAFRFRANWPSDSFKIYEMKTPKQNTNTNRFVELQRAVWINYFGYELHLRHHTGLAIKMKKFENYSERLDQCANNLTGFPSETAKNSRAIYEIWDSSQQILSYPTTANKN